MVHTHEVTGSIPVTATKIIRHAETCLRSWRFFKCGDLMKNKICQSCGMPMTKEQYGTNCDGSKNTDYCKYCFVNGDFIDKVSMEEYIEMCSKYGFQAGMTNEEMFEFCKKLFPTLKRWKK